MRHLPCPGLKRRSCGALLLVGMLGLGACGRLGVTLLEERDAGEQPAVPDAGPVAATRNRDASVFGAADGGAGGNGRRDAAISEPADPRDAGTDPIASAAKDAAVADAATPSRDAGVAGGGGAGATPDAGPSAECGNAVVEPGEECDDAVATARCDADCSFASCGDGVLNPQAGEQCDSGDRLGSCTVRCTLPTCRAGCECGYYRGTRYMYCAQQLAWTPAHQACEDQGMRLVHIHSGTEQTFLRLLSQQYGFAKFQLGATDIANEGTWVWEDGTVFWMGLANGAAVGGEFAAWAQGEPNAFVPEENCSEVQSIQGWNDCVCDAVKPFICKETRARRDQCGDGALDPGEACDGAGETASCDADCSPAVCGDGLVNVSAGERCDDGDTGQYCNTDCTAFVCPAGCSCLDVAGESFALCSALASFRDAAIGCGRAGMTLARVDSATVDAALRSAANGASIGEYWIGVFDIDQPDHWLRSDLAQAWDGTVAGTSHGYTNFASNAPSGTTDQDCAIVLSDGHWQDRACTEQHAYACERL